jgi:hypothetical protein
MSPGDHGECERRLVSGIYPIFFKFKFRRWHRCRDASSTRNTYGNYIILWMRQTAAAARMKPFGQRVGLSLDR